jgi:hypothetical protein
VQGSRILATIQTRLEIGAPNDRFEREADRVAEEVLRTPANAAAASAPAGSPERSVQRMCDDCAEEKAQLQRMPRADAPGLPRISTLGCGFGAQLPQPAQAARAQDDEIEEELALQAKSAAGTDAETVPGVAHELQSPQGRGRPLSPNERAFFEPRFGTILARCACMSTPRRLNQRAR